MVKRDGWMDAFQSYQDDGKVIMNGCMQWNPVFRWKDFNLNQVLSQGPLDQQISTYRKNSRNWDTLNYYRDCPTNGIVGFYSAILRSKDADRITNRVDTDQTAP